MSQILTQVKARELLKELQYAKAQQGQLSIRDEYFKQALERVVAGAPEGWKLVPLVAFPSQWAKGQKAFEEAGINKIDPVYKAMVAAAPEAPL